MANENIYQSRFTGAEMDAFDVLTEELAAAITALELAVAAKYTKPASGIPSTDMDADVNAALAKANSAIQSLADYYTKSEVDAMVATVNAQEYIDVATLPAASVDTLGKIYLVGPTSGEYARYITTVNGSTYDWVQIGTTEISMANYATKAELSQLDQEVNLLSGNTIDLTPTLEMRQGYIERNGKITAYSSWYYAVFLLEAGNTIVVDNTNIGSYPSLGIAESGNVTIGDTTTVVPGKTYTASEDTWIVISAGTRLNSAIVSSAINLGAINSRFVYNDVASLDSTIPGCYPRIDTKTLYESSSFNTSVYNVTGAKVVVIQCAGVNTTYYGIAFSSANNVFDNTSKWLAYPGSGTYTGTFTVIVPEGKTYMAIDRSTTISILAFEHNDDAIALIQRDAHLLNNMFLSGYYGKRIIYIGDSISSADGCYWKGIMLSKYNVNYVRETLQNISPADGGITVIPPETEPESDLAKSIWYRCAANRMGYFTFDAISLFGGTNDMNVEIESDITLGTVSDTPFVDSLTGFDETKAAELTATRPETLTFAAALMGCIEMLHRDFPTKPIFLLTVMPCRGTGYGNTVDSSGIKLSERMAQLQMQIAAKYNGEISDFASTCNYGVTAVPFYWNIRTYEGAKQFVLSHDGVHPNQPCGKRMADAFAKVLNLR